jgi:hypothetical protein
MKRSPRLFGISYLPELVVRAIGFGAVLRVATAIGLAQVPVPVTNPSFETFGPAFSCVYAPGNTCYYTINNLPGWNTGFNSSQFGQYQPGGCAIGCDAQFWNGPSSNSPFANNVTPDDGATVAYITGASPGQYTWVYQDVVPEASVVAGATYTLTIDLGEQSTQDAVGTPGCSPAGTSTCDPTFFDYRAALVMPGTGTFYAEGANPAPGTFGQFTATFVAPSNPTGDLFIDLYGESNPNLEIDYDNVALTETPDPPGTSTPEPGAFFLAAGGLALLFRAKRRHTA